MCRWWNAKAIILNAWLYRYFKLYRNAKIVKKLKCTTLTEMYYSYLTPELWNRCICVLRLCRKQQHRPHDFSCVRLRNRVHVHIHAARKRNFWEFYCAISGNAKKVEYIQLGAVAPFIFRDNYLKTTTVTYYSKAENKLKTIHSLLISG